MPVTIRPFHKTNPTNNGSRVLGESPRGEMLIVNANLREAFETADVADSRDMKNFVDRMLGQVPHLPDALTLQEVNGVSAAKVAELMSKATGRPYAVVTRPPNDPYVDGGTNDTAVIVNKHAVSVGRTGFIKHDLRPADASRLYPEGKDKYTAYAELAEKRGEATMNVAAVHFTIAMNVSSKERSYELKRDWSKQIDRRLKALSGETNVIAGDFNNRRQTTRRETTKPGNETPFYEALMSRGYHDSVFEAAPEQIDGGKRIDFVFHDGETVAASGDPTYGRELRADGIGHTADGTKYEKLNPKTFYSDHAFNWAIIKG